MTALRTQNMGLDWSALIATRQKPAADNNTLCTFMPVLNLWAAPSCAA
jgi:hypothetical protein